MARIRYRQDGEEIVHELTDQVTTIGRASVNIIPIQDEGMSRKHCRIERTENRYRLVDLESNNGTMVNGIKIHEQTLKMGDVIKVGQTEIQFEEDIQPSAEEFDRTVPIPVMEEGPVSHEAPAPPAKPDTFILVQLSEDGKSDIRTYPLGDERCTIGRHPSNVITIHSESGSNYHAEIVREGDNFVISDLGSTNGTKVNGEKIIKTPLSHGARIEIGRINFVFRNTALPEKTEGEPLFGTVVLNDEEFLKSLENEVKGTKIAKYAGFTICLATILVALVVLKSKDIAFWKHHDDGIPIMENNLLTINPTFENGQSPDGFPDGWTYRRHRSVLMTLDMNDTHSGTASLKIEPSQSTPIHSMAACETKQPIAVEPGKAYQVAGWLKTYNMQGLAGLAIQWQGRGLQGLHSLESTRFLSGTHPWRKVQDIVTAPSWATQAQFVCLLAGNIGIAWYDDVSLTAAAPTAAAHHPHTIRFKQYEVEISPQGIFSISQNGRPFFWDIGVTVDCGTGYLISQNLAEIITGTMETNAEGFRCEGRMMDIATSAWIGYQQFIRFSTDKLQIRYDMTLPPGTAIKSAGLSMSSSSNALQDGFSVDDGQGLVTVTSENFSQPIVDALELVWKRQDGEFAWNLGGKSIFKGERHFDGRLRYRQIRAASSSTAGGFSLSVFFKTSSTRIETDIAAMLDKADTARMQGDYGAAIQLYKDLVVKYPHRKEAEQARTLSAQLSNEGGKALQRLQTALQRIQQESTKQSLEKFEARLTQLNALRDESEQLLHAYAASPIAEQTRPIADELASMIQTLKQAKEDADAEALFRKAEKAYRGENWIIAKAYYAQVISKYPNSRLANDARQKLNILESIQKEARERDLWIDKMMKKAQNYLQNPGGQAPARRILEEIQRKYPGNPRQHEIEQMLNQVSP